MFQKFLASVGIGAAKVDTVLERDEWVIGEEVRGVVHITGGAVAQKVDSIYVTLSTTYIRETDDHKVAVKYHLAKLRVSEALTITPNEKRELPFSLTLPAEAPLTFGLKKVWLHTDLDIKSSIDPTDTDYIQVQPNALLKSVLDAVQDLGFRLRQAECEYVPPRLQQGLPFAQELEFIPVSGTFYKKLDELELLLFPRSLHEIEILMEIDRKAKGLAGLFSEALDLDETKVRFTVTSANVANLTQMLEATIRKYC